MEKCLEIIKDRIDYYKNDPRIMIDNENFIFIQSIEKLLNEYQKEKQENEKLKMLEEDIKNKRIVYIDTQEFKENYIPKNKIMEKIKKLKNEYRNIAQTSDFIIADTIQSKIQILEELLEEENNEILY